MQDGGDQTIPADVQAKLLQFARAALAVSVVMLLPRVLSYDNTYVVPSGESKRSAAAGHWKNESALRRALAAVLADEIVNRFDTPKRGAL